MPVVLLHAWRGRRGGRATARRLGGANPRGTGLRGDRRRVEAGHALEPAPQRRVGGQVQQRRADEQREETPRRAVLRGQRLGSAAG